MIRTKLPFVQGACVLISVSLLSRIVFNCNISLYRFLRDACKVENCPFSHKLAPEKMPDCLYFMSDKCNLDPCPYRHVKVSSDAPICKAFVQGYCPKGNQVC